MSEQEKLYTPTTEEVRNAYGVLRNSYKIQRFDQEFDRGYIAEFDRWLIAERKRVAEMAQERLLSKINRVTLVDDDRGGIQYERYNIDVETSIQDNGQTLKLFIKGAE